MRTWQIYGLVDPRADSIRYVGCTVEPYLSRRLSNHLTDARGKVRSSTGKPRTDPKNLWLRELLALGLRPTIVLLQGEITERDEAQQIEMEWVRRLPDLTNELDGVNDREVRSRWFYSLSDEDQQRTMEIFRAGQTPEARARGRAKVAAALKARHQAS